METVPERSIGESVPETLTVPSIRPVTQAPFTPTRERISAGSIPPTLRSTCAGSPRSTPTVALPVTRPVAPSTSSESTCTFPAS